MGRSFKLRPSKHFDRECLVTASRIVPVAGFLLLAFAVTLDVMMAERLGQFCVLPGWTVDAIPAVLSQLHWGHAADDSQLSAVNDVFRGALRGFGCASIDQAITSVLQLPAGISREISLLGTDDKGIVDFVRLSFLIFGWRASSIPMFYFLIVAISATAYWVTFRRDSAAIAIGALLIACHSAILPYAAEYPQLSGFLALRFMPLMGLLAGLHLVLASFRGHRSHSDLAALVVQSLIVALTVQIRFSAIWILLTIAIAAVFCLIWYRGTWSGRLNILIPLMVCLVFTSTYSLTRSASMNDAYLDDRNLHGHVFWHSLASGLAFSDKLHKEHKLKLDDVSVIAATGEYLKRTGQSDYWKKIGGETSWYSGIHWNAYEFAVREMLFDICKNDSVECLRAALIAKPFALISNVAWISGLGSLNPPTPHLLDKTVYAQLVKTRQNLDRQGWKGPLGLWTIVIMVAGVLLVALDRARATPSVGISLAILLSGSTLPTVLAYPIPHAVGEPVVLIWTSVLCLPILGIALWVAHRRRNELKRSNL